MAKKLQSKGLITQNSKNPETQQTAFSLSITEDFLPAPEDMERYERLHPTITEKLTNAFISQMKHRMLLEETVVIGDDKRATRAQYISAFLAVFFGSIGAYLIVNHFDIAGYVSLVGVLGGLIGAFFGGAIIRSIERKKKKP